MKEIIYQDQRIADEFCNFKCEYCGGFYQSEYTLAVDKERNIKLPKEWYNNMNKSPKEVKKYFEKKRDLDSFYELFLEVIDKTKQSFNTNVLKVSGGEVTLKKNLIEYIEKIHNKYVKIQILTNGFLLNENEIIKYKKMGNVCFQISIDGIDYKSNYTRTHYASITNKVIQNIEYMLKHNIGIEINCVLTKHNIDYMENFFEKFKSANNFIIIPRPVRGEPKENLNFDKVQIEKFEKLIKEKYEQYKSILPSKVYFERLIDIMKNDVRNTKCYIPHFVQSIDGYGNLEDCPIGIITKSKFNILEKNNYKLNTLTFENNQVCKNCTNQYEMFNLFVEDRIEENDLKKIPSLNNEYIIANIQNIKQNIILDEIKKCLLRDYKICVDSIEKSQKSTNGNVYIITNKKNKYVVKVYKNLEHVDAMIQVHQLLVKNNFRIPDIINSSLGNFYCGFMEYKYIIVYEFMEGEPIYWDKTTNKLNPSIIKKIAQKLRKMHEITKNRHLNLPSFKCDKDDSDYSLLHFDLTKDNIFINEDEIALIDFDDAKYGDYLYDLAIFIANLFFSKTRGADLEGIHIFLNEYYDNNDKDRMNIISKIKIYAIEWINYILNGNEFDASTTESLEVRLELIKKYL